LTILRRERIGFVFQAFNLLPSLTVAQNIALPLRLDGRRLRRSIVREIAARVGLEKRLRDRPSQLSGGQQQRVAIARALITRPEVVFADEPTGALDTRTGHEVLALLREVADEDGHTVVMVTHDPSAAAYPDRVILLADGRGAGTLAARLATVPGVQAAIGDVSVPARLGYRAAVAHGWSSAALTPYVLSAGRSPTQPGEVVTGYPAALGARLRLAATEPA
jgi:putative ABC transport system ATP-binding protein